MHMSENGKMVMIRKIYTDTASLALRMPCGGKVRCLWYFLFAHAACAPDNLFLYTATKRAAQFANL